MWMEGQSDLIVTLTLLDNHAKCASHELSFASTSEYRYAISRWQRLSDDPDDKTPREDDKRQKHIPISLLGQHF